MISNPRCLALDKLYRLSNCRGKCQARYLLKSNFSLQFSQSVLFSNELLKKRSFISAPIVLYGLRSNTTLASNEISNSNLKQQRNSETASSTGKPFKLLQLKDLPEYQVTAFEYQHEATGTRLLHLAAPQDPNNAFIIGFPTPSTTSTGVAHILEHLVLCGSESFQVRDPFFKMTRRSLNTYMNALTAQDITMFPFSTCNEKDYENLLNVYLDAVFFPNLHPLDFAQEAWRISVTSSKSSSSEKSDMAEADRSDEDHPNVAMQGVVFNEMKGCMSDPGYVFYTEFQKSYFGEATVYGSNSGGNPLRIPSLTHNNLKQFHALNYNPEKARIITYGSVDVNRIMDIVDPILRKAANSSRIQRSSRSEETTGHNQIDKTVVEAKGPFDPLAPANKQLKVSITFPISDADPFIQFCLSIISNLLLDQHASPFYKAFIETEFCTSFTPNTGFEPYQPYLSFSIGASGVDNEYDVSKFESLVRETFKKCAEQGVGLESERLESVLHQVELSTKHRGSMYGLSLSQSLMMRYARHPTPDVLEQLNLDLYIKKLKEEGGAKFLQDIVKNRLFENKKAFTFCMRPDPNFDQTLDKAINNMTNSLLSSQTSESIGELQGLESKLQDHIHATTSEDAAKCLPSLAITEIPLKKPLIEAYDDKFNKVNKFSASKTYLLDAKEVSYLRGLVEIDFSEIPPHLVSYLPLLCEALRNLGTRSMSMEILEEKIKRYTGDISFDVSVRRNITNPSEGKLQFFFSTYCLNRNVDTSMELMSLLLNDTNWLLDDKLQILIRGRASSLSESIADSGHALAMSSVKGLFLDNIPSVMENVMFGIPHIQSMHKISTSDKSIHNAVDLCELHDIILPKLRDARYLVTSDEKTARSINDKLNNTFLQPQHGNENANEASKSADFDLNDRSTAKRANLTNQEYGLKLAKQAINKNKIWYDYPANVYYAALGIQAPKYVSEDAPAFQLTAYLLKHYLHREIREKGGAYGGSCIYSPMEGSLLFYSYRDPNPLKSLEAIRKISDHSLPELITESEALNEAKLSLFQQIDRPESISSKGLVYFKNDVTQETMAKRRQALLNVSLDQCVDIFERKLRPSLADDKLTKMAVIGSSKDKRSAENGFEVCKLK